MTAADLPGRIQETVHELIDGGAETGAQVAVIHHGAVVADVVGGVADPASGCPVSPGTLFWAASTAKGMASTVVHVLAERGELDYDLRVADVWPEFAAHGKDTVTVRHVLCHTAGIPALPPGTIPDDLCDWERICALLASAEPGGARVPALATTPTRSGTWWAKPCAARPGAPFRSCCAT